MTRRTAGSAARRRVRCAGLATVLALAGCLGAPVDNPSTDVGGSPGVTTEPLPTVPVEVRVLGATGDALWVSFPQSSDQSVLSGQQVSTDGGATWVRGPYYDELGASTAGAGRFALYGGGDGEAWPMTFGPAESPKVASLSWDEEWSLRALGSTMALTTNGRLVGGDSRAKVRFPALPSKLGKARHSYQFSADSKYLARVSHPAKGSADYVSVMTTATRKASKPVRLPRSNHHVVGGAGLYSLVARRTGLDVCQFTLASLEQQCNQIVVGDQRGSKAVLYQAGPISLVKDPAGSSLMVEQGVVTPIALPAGTVSWRIDGPGDPTRPLIRTVDAAGEPHYLRIAADGSVTEYLTPRRVPVQPWTLALTPTALLGADARDERHVWARDISSGTLGDLSLIPGASVATASGSRWLLRGSDNKLWAYDDGRVTATIKWLNAREQSGPYLIGNATRGAEKVGLVTGRMLKTQRAMAVFGSLVVEDVSKSHKNGYTVRVRDLADSGFTPKTFKLTDRRYRYSWVMMWGDWVGTTVASDAADHDFEIVLHNYVTGATVTRPGELAYLGDGFAITQTYDPDVGYPLAVWNLTSGAETPLGNGSGYAPFAVAGARIAYTDDTQLILRTFDGLATSPPRLLGALTSGEATSASPWRLAADLTKPVDAGTLVIRNKAGTVIRTLATTASATGSVRGISWDGRDESGRKVAGGSYRWNLVVQASDGSGAAQSVTGMTPAGGRITLR